MKQIKASDFTDEHFGLPTILDILSELEKPQPRTDSRPQTTTQRACPNQFGDGGCVCEVEAVSPTAGMYSDRCSGGFCPCFFCYFKYVYSHDAV
ncbi:TPA: hypothetical protein ACE6I1_001345 [Neisseria gonorrhoeae]|nr:hypothetical protein [Neisseria gonorrhoeae]